MDIWKYYDITHKKHLICNPMSKVKLDRLFLLLDIKAGSKVLDMGSGKGETLIRLAELFGIHGTGVEISSYYIKDARKKKNERVPESDVKFYELDGADYKPDYNELFDLTICLGASFIYNGFKGTIDALKGMTKSKGLMILGEPYWLKTPSEEYLKMSGINKDDFNDHFTNIYVAEKEGLNCLYTLVSNNDDWDHYETLQWLAVYDYIKLNKDDPDNTELLEKTEKAKKEYLLYGRDTVGWAIYLFEKR